MSLYIAHKAFPVESDFAAAKVGIFLASLIAGGLGTALLWRAAASDLGKNNQTIQPARALR
jgi:NhaA family Na+:H+ antiporter